MSDFDNAVALSRAAEAAGQEIPDAVARVIASLYHEGQASVSYSFASTGAIPETADDLWREMWPSGYDGLSDDEKVLFGMFGTYALNRADRGPVPGWSRLWI